MHLLNPLHLLRPSWSDTSSLEPPSMLLIITLPRTYFCHHAILNLNIYLYVCMFIFCSKGRHSSRQMPTAAMAGPAEETSSELHLGLPQGWQRPKRLTRRLCAKAVQQWKLNDTWSSWDLSHWNASNPSDSITSAPQCLPQRPVHVTFSPIKLWAPWRKTLHFVRFSTSGGT